jgi:hypothetical protein
MSDLHPTKTRLALLRAVAAGKAHVETSPPYDSYAAGMGKVTARCEQMYRAGWIEQGEPGTFVRNYRLTDAGRAVLAAAESGGGDVQ